jgi:YHS domain-containing protein
MVRLILWLILLSILLRIAWRFVHAVFEGAGLLRDPQERAAVKLVRDPVCGVYVVPTKALTAGSGSATKYFCSEKCRQQWSAK